MKKINELNRVEKLMLLSAIRNGEIQRADLTADCFIQTEMANLFNVLIELETKKMQGHDIRVFFIGDALNAVKTTKLPIIAYKLANKEC